MILPIERHENAVLQYSGGKDSHAILLMLEKWWERITVLWVNTGDAFPETLNHMARTRARVPHFREVRTDQPAQIEEHGWPTEIVPVGNTEFGRLTEGTDAQLMQSYISCCAANVWAPMAAAVKEIGATLVIRGTRAEDFRRAPVASGDVFDGVEYWLPLEDWSDAEVRLFLEGRGELPEHYEHTDTSLDCRHCTAYLHENVRKLKWMADAHPAEHREVMRRLKMIRRAAGVQLSVIDAVMQGGEAWRY